MDRRATFGLSVAGGGRFDLYPPHRIQKLPNLAVDGPRLGNCNEAGRQGTNLCTAATMFSPGCGGDETGNRVCKFRSTQLVVDQMADIVNANFQLGFRLFGRRDGQ